MAIALRIEFLKLMRKPRTYIGPAAMAILTILILVGLKYGNEFNYLMDRLNQEFIITGPIVNSAFLTRFVLEAIAFFLLPLFACMVFGDLLASEASDGTLRMLLCRPVTRNRIIVSKYMVGSVYVLVLTLGTGIWAYAVGSVFLGRGSLLVPPGMANFEGIWILPEHTAIIRLIAAYGLVAFGMLAVGSIAFAISTFLSNSNGAIAGAMAVLIVSSIIGEIEYFAVLKPYLLTTHLQAWHGFFTDSLSLQLLAKSIGVMLIYSAIAFIAGTLIFQRRDVLS